jgi:hypothetical protein
MPEKILIAGQLINEKGDCCAIGAVCKARSLDVSKIDYWDADSVAKAIGVARSMAAEIEYENDEGYRRPDPETPEARWTRMLKWASDLIKS